MSSAQSRALPSGPYGNIAEMGVWERSRPATSGAESKLAARLAARLPGAIEAVYERYGRACFAYLMATLGDRGAAEDVQQQVFLEVWQRAGSYDPERAGLLTWIMVIARSRALDHLRRRVPEPVASADEHRFQQEPDQAEALAERWRLAGLLSRLHPEEAMVLRMRFYDELTQAEISARTELPLGTVKLRMVRGLARLRDLIEEES